MLNSITNGEEPALNTHRGLQKCARHHLTVTGWSIAKAERTPCERAELAARWLLGSLTIEPTVTLAAQVFGVSLPLVRHKVRFFKANTVAAAPIDHVYAVMTEAERDAFVGAHITDIWTRIDRLTA
jgi:hypothetical protein